MDLDVVFLGTAASMPTAQRGPAALLVRRGSERLLFDCGEGTQRQLQRSAIGLPDLQEIFLTHFHADHFLGLPGMLKTFALRGRDETPLTVYGPRPGRRLVLTGDTAPSPVVVQAAHGADLLVHEASFLTEEAERARETLHSTAAEAAEVARLAQVRLLALTHVSPRYFGPELADEARGVFPDTVVPRDFDLIEVPFPERGAPRLVKSGARPPRTEEVPMIEPS